MNDQVLFAPVKVLFILILIGLVVACILWAIKSPTGRWFLGIGGALLLLFLMSIVYIRVRRGEEVNARQEAIVAVRAANDFQAWKDAEVIRQGPAESAKAWIQDSGGARRVSESFGRFSMDLEVPGPEGQIVGYSRLEPTEEDALKAARSSLAEKVKALVKLEIARSYQDPSDPDFWGKIDVLVPRYLDQPSAEADLFHEEVRLPASGKIVHRAAVMAKVPGTLVPQIASQVSEMARGMKAQAQEARQTWAWTIFSALVLALFIFIIYSFLNAGTKGHLAWPLRLVSITAFLLLCIGLLVVRGHIP